MFRFKTVRLETPETIWNWLVANAEQDNNFKIIINYNFEKKLKLKFLLSIEFEPTTTGICDQRLNR